MVDYTKRDQVALLRDFLNVVGTETEGVEVRITQDDDNGMRFYSDADVLLEVHNNTGAQLDKGEAVYVSGTHTSGKPLVVKARCDSTSTMPAIGLVQADIANGAEGLVVVSGTLRNFDTSTPSWSAGDQLYVDASTAGAMTSTRPTASSQQVQKVAIVTRVHATAGSLVVVGASRTNDVPNEITALTGVALDAANLGTFTGTTIADNETIKGALQDVETALDASTADGAITTARLSDGAVTEAKLANTHVLRADRQVGNPYATLSTTTITEWYSFEIPANTLATRNVRVLAHGTLKQNSGSSQNFRAVVRLGGTDIHEAAGSIADDADDAIWRMELELSYRANRNQFMSGTWRVSGQYNSADGISNIFGITKDGIWGNDAVTENDTGNLALSFHQKWDTSATNCDFKVYAVAVEYV